MKDMLWLVRKTLISTFKNYKNWLLYLGLPVAAIVLAILIHSGSSGAAVLNIGFVNNDRDQVVTQDTIDFISGMDSVRTSEIREVETSDLLISGEFDAVIIFPAGFAQSLKNGNPESVQIVSVKGTAITGYVKLNLNHYINNLASIGKAAEGDEARFDMLYANYQDASFHLSAETVRDYSADHNTASQTIGYLVVIMLFSAANLSGMMIKEREERTYLRILASAIKPRTYVLSNIVVNLAIMIMQIVITLLVMNKILQIDPGIPYGFMFLILVLFALVAISLSLVIVAFSKSSMAANSFQGMLFLSTCLLAGCMFPLEMIPATIQSIAHFLPQYWLLDTFGKLQQGNPLESLYANLLILIAFAAALSLIAAYKVGRNNDTQSYI